VNRNNLKAALNLLAPQAAEAAKQRLDQAQANATGRLRESIRGGVDETQDTIRLFLTAEDYYNVINDGRKAGARTPPPNKIMNWIKVKGISSNRQDVKNIKQLTFLISRAIARNGTIKRFGYKGVGLTQYILQSLGSKLLNDVKKAYQKDIEQAIKDGRGKG
jgi:hypothetical protein